jgi:NDP-sugar pyrophosphorylase family protein
MIIVKMDFEVIVLVGGRGEFLYPLAEHTPKFLLPIGNKPLIAYTLEMLERSGEVFRKIYLAVPENFNTKLEKYIQKKYRKLSSNTFEIIPIPEEHSGTFKTITYLAPRLTANLLLVSADLILDFDVLESFLAQFRLKDVEGSVLLYSMNVPPEEVQIYALDKNRVVSVFNWVDYEEGIRIRKSLLQHAPRMRLTNELQNSYCMCFKGDVFKKILSQDEARISKFTSLKEDFLPYIYRRQFAQDFIQAVLPEGDEYDLYFGKPPRPREVKISYMIADPKSFCMRICFIRNYKDINQLCCYNITGTGKTVHQPLALLTTANNRPNYIERIHIIPSQDPSITNLKK